MAALGQSIEHLCAHASRAGVDGPLVVEVGANEGAHGLAAAKWGCRCALNLD